MRCSEKEFQPGAIFHIYNHAIDDYNLFYDDEDYDYFLQLFEDKLKKIPTSLYAYCLMPDHYHFLIQQESDRKIFNLFNYLGISYAHYYNKKHERKGPIFRSPLQHIKVDNDIYLLQLSKYIHLNPVRKELINNPEDWNYSDYRRWTDNDFTSKIPFNKPNEKLLPTKYTEFVKSWYNSFSNREFWQLISKHKATI